jgi:hypothetical protein
MSQLMKTSAAEQNTKLKASQDVFMVYSDIFQ